MNCREARPLLPLFFDGELDARQLRNVALHSTRCPACERELQQLEHLQDLVVDHVRAGIEDIDLCRIWAGVAPRIASVSVPWRSRMRARWEALDFSLRWPVPALASLAAVALLAVALWPGAPATNQGLTAQTAAIDNSASLDVVESHVESIALVSEPETHTMVLWINDEDPVGVSEINEFGELP
jgi:anti-sigma factor RsiW